MYNDGMESFEESFERESTKIATQQEKLQLLAEVEKVSAFGEDMSGYAESGGLANSIDAIDNAYLGRATHKTNQDIDSISCKFDLNALRNGRGDRLIAQLTMGGHTYDFFLKYPELSDQEYVEGEDVSSALEEMWDCDELYDVTYDESGNEIRRDPNKPVYMPAGDYTLSNDELLEVYVDMPADRRKFSRALSDLAGQFVDLMPEGEDTDEMRLAWMSAAEHAEDDYKAREFETSLGTTQIDGTTARQLAKSLAEDYEIDMR